MIEWALQYIRKENEAEEIPFWTTLGPLSLLCTLSISGSLDLLFISLAGLYLTSRWRMRGCVYALILLGFGALIRHFCFSEGHLWQLGLEASIGVAFFISALAFEQGSSFIQALTEQMETRDQSIQQLEEELEKERQTAVAQQTTLQEKVVSLQKEGDELQADHSTLLILNEVLRKTTARQGEEKEALSEAVLDAQARITVLQTEKEDLSRDLKRLSNSEALILENKTLRKELNTARVDKEQTHLINETLARLHAKECLKSKEAFEQIHVFLDEKRKLQEEFSFSRGEIEMLNKRLEQLFAENEATKGAYAQLKEIQNERNFLRERLSSAEQELALQKGRPDPQLVLSLREELSRLQEQLVHRPDPELMRSLKEELTGLQEQLAHRPPPELVETLKEENSRLQEQMAQRLDPEVVTTLQQERSRLSEQMIYLQDKMGSLAQVELLYKQLKKQFEEKNQILHQTRSELFRTDTELQTMKMEQQQREMQVFPSEIANEMAKLDRELGYLEEENQQLQDLISLLNGQPISTNRKKKVKMKSDDLQLSF